MSAHGSDRPSTGRSDEELVAATSRGDGAAFGEFYLRHADAITLYFVRRTYSAQDSADLSEETFAQALRTIRRFDPARGEARGWLFGIARNVLRDWYRTGRSEDKARRRIGLRASVFDEDELRRIEELADVASIADDLQAALDELSPALRDAVVLRVNCQQPYEEVARALGCTVGAARVRVTRALAQLHESLTGPT